MPYDFGEPPDDFNFERYYKKQDADLQSDLDRYLLRFQSRVQKCAQLLRERDAFIEGCDLEDAYKLFDRQMRSVITQSITNLKDVDDTYLKLQTTLKSLSRNGLKALGKARDMPKEGFFVYALYAQGQKTPVYIGQSTIWLSRVGQHATQSKQWDYARVIEVESAETMHALEAALIVHYKPQYNKAIPKPKKSWILVRASQKRWFA